jgi:alpha-mannosidase
MIHTAGATSQRFMVLNPLGWQRTDVADLPYTGGIPAHVIDLSTGAEVPSQVVSLDGQRALRILASEVPPAGYKVYEVREGAGQPFSGGLAASAASGVIENDVYTVTVSGRGAITGLIDKTRVGRQFVREIGGYAMNDLGPGEGTLSVENAGPVSVTLKATSPTPLSHTTRITLVRGSDRIRIHNEITQNFTDVRQWRFGFEIDSPDVWHEEVGAIIRARLLADGGHYAPRNARYDWLTLNHFADISGGGMGMTLANADCYFMQLGASTLSTLDTHTPQLSPLAGGQVDGPDFGIPNQDGDVHFVQRFALRAHDAFDPAAAMRFAMEQQNPFVTRALTGDGPSPATGFSLLSLSNPDVLLWALKPAEEGAQAGIVARVWNLANTPATTTLSSPMGALHSAEQLTHLETPLQPAPVIDHALTITLAPQQLKTFALQLHERPANSQ